MRILITGVCGFAGSSLARHIPELLTGAEIIGIDNLSRPGSERNRTALRRFGVETRHGDLRMASDLEALPAVDWVIDAAANPSALAGVDGKSSSRQLMEHNLIGSVNLLEYCRRVNAGLVLLSTSRVYSISLLASLPVERCHNAFALDPNAALPAGVTGRGISETFSTEPPVSLYGASKRASELLALEYGAAFGFPVWVNRCGVLAGAGQFGTAEQGIFSYWLHAHAARAALRYIGFGGQGYQVRDAFHPTDLAALAIRQMQIGAAAGPRIMNAGGGAANAMSLAELTAWCDREFGGHLPVADTRPRPFDVPWMVIDSGLACREFDWRITRTLPMILDEIARHVRENPDWLAGVV